MGGFGPRGRDSSGAPDPDSCEPHDLEGEMFGFPRLQRLVTEHNEQRSLVDFLMEELYSFVGQGREQEDDITLVTLRRSAT